MATRGGPLSRKTSLRYRDSWDSRYTQQLAAMVQGWRAGADGGSRHRKNITQYDQRGKDTLPLTSPIPPAEHRRYLELIPEPNAAPSMYTAG